MPITEERYEDLADTIIVAILGDPDWEAEDFVDNNYDEWGDELEYDLEIHETHFPKKTELLQNKKFLDLLHEGELAQIDIDKLWKKVEDYYEYWQCLTNEEVGRIVRDKEEEENDED